MEFSAAICGAAVILLLLHYHLLRRRHTAKLPPQAGGAGLILGHLHLMSDGAKPPHLNLADVADQQGPLFAIRLGARQVVVVSSWKIAKELFTTCDMAVSSRPKIRAFEHLSYNFAMVAFSPYGEYWRELRKIVNAELLASRRIQQLSHAIIPAIAQSIREIYSRWAEQNDDVSGQVLVDMKKWFSELNLTVILTAVFGKTFRAGESGAGEAEMRRCRAVIREYFHLAGVFAPADALPWLRWLDLGGIEKRMKTTAAELDGIMEELLSEHRRKGFSGEYTPQDFMDVMLSTVRSSNTLTDKFDENTVVKSTCLAMLLGGADTSSVMLTWALSLLLNNRHVLTRAQQELDSQVGRNRRVTESDIPNLVYLQAIIKETLRLYPAAPLGAPREFTEDCDIGEYHIPKGTWLMVNIWKLQRDPDVWVDDVSQFKPERFLTTHMNVDVRGKDFKLMPFGGGRRICPGPNLALHMLHLVLANLLHAFEIRMVCDDAVDMTESIGLTNLKATPLEVLVSPRLSSTLY
ncbi:cytochrome P450 CYP82D47-like isoform X2 [Andrographis paniculata]|uniref:cytochrome P450 CYP82D47-like isoform X2 n=1 Tax=Andrographis paniculata TaxID=175694 RepID=UPI0021E8A712|nr:cytochrome P450 CYP82D47-like isoform X2 [Andrographis paniculata]